MAIRKHQQAATDCLIDHGTHLSIYTAAGAGRLNLVQCFLSGVDPKLLSTPDEGGRTALHWAVGGGQKEVVEFLLARGADVNANRSRGWTPLCEAAETGDVAMVKLLLAHGATPNVHIPLLNGMITPSPLLIAMARHHQEIVDLLKNCK